MIGVWEEMRGRNRLRHLHNSSVSLLHQQKSQSINSLQSSTNTNPYPSKKTLTLSQLHRTKNKPQPAGDGDIKQWNMSITNHMRNGRCDLALNVFNSMPRRSSVSYNALITGYLLNGQIDLAREVFDKMPQRDLVSWNVMICGYVRNKNLSVARELFERMPVRDVVTWNSLLSGYAQNGYVDEARRVFDRMPEKNEISWNALLSAYVQNGRIVEACRLFGSKMDWEVVSWNCLMGGFMKKKRLVDARRLFDRMPMRDEVSWNIMVTGYAQNNDLAEAQRLFEMAPVRDVFTWTALVSGFVQNQMIDEARRIFDAMPEKNEVSWNAMIAGYVQSKQMDIARELFEEMPCRNVTSWNTIITGYAQCGDVDQARSLFDMMPWRDSVSWAAMIAGYVQSGYAEEALRLFIEMKRDTCRLNRSMFTCLLSACANVAALELGKQLHSHLIKVGFEAGCYVGNALLAMYCKCGSVEEAYLAFEDVSNKDIVSWNTIIAGYSRHGFGKKALMLFESMKTFGVRPDDVTMVGVLSACSHTGLVDKGTEFFHLMKKEYGIMANSKHYTCLVDLLGRAGRLDEALNLMTNMPFKPDAATWGALLGACRIHGNTELGEKAAEVIFEMEPDNAGMYVLLSNLYAASGRWHDVSKMRLKMRDKGVKKVTGFSWLEVQNKMHTFSVGDRHHPERERIYAYLEELELKMKKDGYVHSTNLVLHDVGEEEKEHMLRYHSEKLAVAYGILSTPAGRPIRVIKNLRVCEDCHNAIKHISKIENRLIILRDNNRFHHFSGGSCSCGDYW